MITSAANPRLKLVRRLRSPRQRRRLGLFVVEGEDLVEAGRAAGLHPVDVLVAGEDVEPKLLPSLSELPHPPRVVAVFRLADLPRLQPGAQASGLALWRVADPGNVGSILRSAQGLGAGFVALSPGCADITGPKALRASAGAVFHIPTCGFDQAPGRRVALVAHGGRPLPEVDLEGDVCLILGAEREGVPEEIVASCAERATIPLAEGAESLNVAAAAAIALYEWRRRLGLSGGTSRAGRSGSDPSDPLP